MYKFFWLYFHQIMFVIMVFIWMLKEIVDGGKDVVSDLKSKEKRFNGELFMLAIILGIFVFTLYGFVFYSLKEKSVISIGFAILYFGILGYITIKYTIKTVFGHKKGAFSISDIREFVFTYLFWWILIAIMQSPQIEANLLDRIAFDYGEIIKVGMLLLCNYYNIFFALGGTYILFCHLNGIKKLLKNVYEYTKNRKPKHEVRIFEWDKKGKKFSGLKSYRIWKENKKRFIAKIVMTIPLFLFDIWNVFWMFVIILAKACVSGIIDAIQEPFQELCKLVKKAWNRYENNEWMCMFAQIAGLCSYCIVFVMVQGEGFEDNVKNVYEFVGTVILIPYFLNKINKYKEKTAEKTE